MLLFITVMLIKEHFIICLTIWSQVIIGIACNFLTAILLVFIRGCGQKLTCHYLYNLCCYWCVLVNCDCHWCVLILIIFSTTRCCSLITWLVTDQLSRFLIVDIHASGIFFYNFCLCCFFPLNNKKHITHFRKKKIF